MKFREIDIEVIIFQISSKILDSENYTKQKNDFNYLREEKKRRFEEMNLPLSLNFKK
jgi:hypothetical protein